MIDEQVEFSISQYADGSLPPGERDALEARLADDAGLRDLLGEYRKLDGVLGAVEPVPAVDWDRLATTISSSISDSLESATPVVSYKMPWVGRIGGLAVAASVLIVVGIGLHERFVRPVSPSAAPAIVAVAGPEPETANGAVVQDISIGPSPAVAEADGGWRYADSVVARPQRVVIASGSDAAQDTSSTPY